LSEYQISREDETLLARLRNSLSESDAVPSDVISFAKAAFSWRTIDAELAELDYDSVEEDVPAGVRSAATARMISFQAGQWMLDIEFDESAGRLLGHISPRAEYTVELHSAGALFTVQSDEMGRFEAEGVRPGPVSMILSFVDGTVIKTQWVVL
jgi:hypothetical protein